MALYNVNQLLIACNADNTEINCMIASTIINMYNRAKNFFAEDAIACMKEFLTKGTISFCNYHLQF